MQLNFEDLINGNILLENKPGRIAGIEEQVGKFLNVPPYTMGFKDALSLRGKFAFAEGQTHCKLTAPGICWSP